MVFGCKNKPLGARIMTKHYILQALNADGKAVYIDNVPNGKNCDCTCAECGGKLIAKNKGRIKVHHFAHENGNDNIRCSQTALHLLAKEIIAEEKRIPIPRNGQIDFHQTDSIEQEKFLGDIIPDLYASCENRPYIVEILVTHEVDEEKLQKIMQHKISAVEIDLSEKTFESKEDVKVAIYNPQNIKILYDDDTRLISERKELLLNYGLKLKVEQDGIIACPYARARVPQNFCKECVFCCKENDESIRCGIVLPILLKPELRNTTNILVNQNKVIFPDEAKKYNESHFGWRMRQAVEHGIMTQMMSSRR